MSSSLRGGFTTGACAAAAAKAAALIFKGQAVEDRVEISLLDGTRERLPVEYARITGDGAEAGVRKDAGDDPDVTQGCMVEVRIRSIPDREILFEAGDGVGTVTRPGLAITPGEPAINPGPRQLMETALREVTDQGFRVRVSIPGGEQLAGQTFNPRLGIQGGLSILGSNGRVKPYSREAVEATIQAALSVARAGGVVYPVLVPGRIGEKAARGNFKLSDIQVVEVGNEWGFALDHLDEHGFSCALLLGHPGKLAKLAGGEFDTHSSRSQGALGLVESVSHRAGITEFPEQSVTVEGFFANLSSQARKDAADAVADAVAQAAYTRTGRAILFSVVLINLTGEILGTSGDLDPWK